MSELVHLRLDEKMRAAIRATVAREQFGSESEFIRDAIRKNVEIYEKIETLRKMQHSLKRRTDKPKPGSDVFREAGLID